MTISLTTNYQHHYQAVISASLKIIINIVDDCHLNKHFDEYLGIEQKLRQYKLGARLLGRLQTYNSGTTSIRLYFVEATSFGRPIIVCPMYIGVAEILCCGGMNVPRLRGNLCKILSATGTSTAH